LDSHDAISQAQRMEIPEGRAHPAVSYEDRSALVDKWRAAFVKQLLTPAWDTASVAWKQNALARGKYQRTVLKPERLKHAIADDLAFLAAHPVRQSNRRSAKGATTKNIMEAYGELSPEHQQIVCDEVDRMMGGELHPADEGGRQ
jgi:hypothetical protein